ncbi:MAG TPA: hypothetical protein VLG76_02335 [Rhabdochlamydiaceae bacterium]|nr:hypothetical protein [Rhabdochlamydiaceae bacterium]
MANYRALVHYNFKKGMEERGIKFLESELLMKATEYGCHNIEILQNEMEPTNVIGVALWHSLEEAKKFQSEWEKKEKQLLQFCKNPPKREFMHVRFSFLEKSKRVA